MLWLQSRPGSLEFRTQRRSGWSADCCGHCRDCGPTGHEPRHWHYSVGQLHRGFGCNASISSHDLMLGRPTIVLASNLGRGKANKFGCRAALFGMPGCRPSWQWPQRGLQKPRPKRPHQTMRSDYCIYNDAEALHCTQGHGNGTGQPW